MAADPYLSHAEDCNAGVLKGQFRRHTKLHDDNIRAVDRAVIRAKQGDPEAVRYLYVRFADNVYGYVLSIVRDTHEAEDVTQAVFAKLMAAVCKYEQRSVPFASWLIRLAHNVAIDHMRRRVATPVDEVRDTHALDADPAMPTRLHPVNEALATLPDDQRAVVVLRHVFGLTPGEIAERLGRSENSIHGLHHRGRRAMQTELRLLESGPATRTHSHDELPAAA